MNRFQRNYSHVIYVNRLYRNGFDFFEFRSRNRVRPSKSWLTRADGRTLHTKILKKFEKLKISKTFQIIGKLTLVYLQLQIGENRALFQKILVGARVLTRQSNRRKKNFSRVLFYCLNFLLTTKTLISESDFSSRDFATGKVCHFEVEMISECLSLFKSNRLKVSIM